MKLLLLIMACGLMGCAGTVTTTITRDMTDPDMEVVTIVSGKNSVVTQHGEAVEVDNTGGDSDFKWFLMQAMTNTDIQVGDGGGSD